MAKTLFQYTEGNAPATTDYCLTGQDPSGSPAMRRLTWASIRNLFVGAPTAAGDFPVSIDGASYVKRTLAQTQVILHPNQLISGVWHKQLWIAGWKPTVTAGCAASVQIEMGTNKNVYDYPAFVNGADKYAYANVESPQDYTGGVVYASPTWFHPATTTNYKVSLGLAGVSIGDGETMDAAVGTYQFSNDTGGNTNYRYKGVQTAAITFAGTPAAGEGWYLQCMRKGTDGTNDTLAQPIYLLGWMIWYPVA